ncbi:Alpha/Beta hydrolase protein [Apodospora peruviana]|uniref:Alpha/Beta hydrolase protein n=1 Tax=Apodospora peruviana TaxID=516989 RepID=A0AAE0HX30_9PEZI|nr:Alpha/Beta hydrolase protein [Apodospora peruviana]
MVDLTATSTSISSVVPKKITEIAVNVNNYPDIHRSTMGNHARQKYTKKNQGLFVLPLPHQDWEKRHGKPNLDIVAVHGLNGDCIRSWTSISPAATGKSTTCWLNELLPHRIPRARVMTFGYNASVFGNTSIAGIRDNARSLLSHLQDGREEEDGVADAASITGRPIVFVGHSLGGIIIKQALRIANNERNSFGDIADSTRGIVFFGTPHRGADAATWASLVSSITAAAFGNGPKSFLLKALKPNSRDLMDLSEDFRPLSMKYAIASFVEQDVYSGLGRVVVEKHSAVMELPHEEVLVIGGNHSSICKFDMDDPRFEAVWRRIKRVSQGPQIPRPPPPVMTTTVTRGLGWNTDQGWVEKWAMEERTR